MPSPQLAQARVVCHEELTRLAIPQLDIDRFLDQVTVGERWVTLVCSSDPSTEENLCLNWQTLFDHIAMLETPDLLWMTDKWGLDPAQGRDQLARLIVGTIERRIEAALQPTPAL